MKTKTALPTLLLSLIVCISACTPRDVAVTPADQRGKIKALSNSRNSGNSTTQTVDFKLGNYALSSFMVEKQIEVIEFLQLAVNSIDAEKSQFKIVGIEDKGEGKVTFGIEAKDSAEGLAYKTNLGTWKYKMSKSLDVEMTLNQELEALTASVHSDEKGLGRLNSASLKSSVDATEIKDVYVDVVETLYSLNVTKSETAGFLDVILRVEGDVRGLKGEGATKGVNAFTMDLKMSVDSASLKSENVKLVKSDIKMTYPGNSGKTFNIGLTAENFEVSTANLCNKIIGTGKVVAGPKIKFDVVFDGLTMKSSDKKFELVQAECGSRPTVDTSVFQKF